jgi:hypothetical protein
MQNNTTIQIVLHYTLNSDYLVEWDKFELYAKDNFPTVNVSKQLEFEELCSDTCACTVKNVSNFPEVFLYGKKFPIVFYGEMKMEELIKFVQDNIL